MQVDDLRLLGIPRWCGELQAASPITMRFQMISQPFRTSEKQTRLISVARVRPEHLRASQTCYCLKLPSAKHRSSVSIRVPYKSTARTTNTLRSRSLTELTRQITPPTKNGHAPPPIESRKSFNLSILTMSGPGKFSRVGSN